jgi:hypothetical protein
MTLFRTLQCFIDDSSMTRYEEILLLFLSLSQTTMGIPKTPFRLQIKRVVRQNRRDLEDLHSYRKEWPEYPK